MAVPPFLEEPRRVEEPRAAQEYSEVLTQVASEGRPVIVRRNGADLAAVIPLDCLELVREILAREEVEKAAGQIDWARAREPLRPPHPAAGQRGLVQVVFPSLARARKA
jgi:PHD/YefM family antitoxin component YafN of YafNO toxin-antitoxin module